MAHAFKRCSVAAVVFVTVLLFQRILAYSEPLKPLKVAYSTVAEMFLPLFLTYESGLFQKYGLDAKIVYINGGSAVVQAMLAGEAPIAMVGGSSVIRSALSGGDLVMIANIVDRFDYLLVVRKEITSVEQLRGRQVAIGRYGGGPDFAIRYVLRKQGLEPDRDVAIVQIAGGMSGRFSAVITGRVDGAVISPFFAAKARELGLVEVIDLIKISPKVESTGLASSRSFIRNQRDTVKSFMKALLEGIFLMKTDKERSITALGKYLRTNDKQGLEAAWEFYSKKIVRQKPYSSDEGVRFVLSSIAKENPQAQWAKPEEFVDMGILAELDQSGFIDNLYKK